MEKLYYENQYIKEFVAEVLDIKEIDNKFHVVLDKTAFFPGGGGQPCDEGLIENLPVIEIYEKDGVIYHVTEKKPIKIHRVKCSLDWKKRFDGMQQHLGQHVLSGCFFKLFNANTCGFHLGKDISTVDIEGILDEETIRKAETMANEIIHSNIKVEFLTPNKKELKKLNLRRDLPKTDEQIRVVIIEDLDINACCGVHPSSTLELQTIKIRKWEKHKNATRVEFLTGNRAVQDSLKKDHYMNLICRYLNTNEEDAIKGIKSLHEELKNAIEVNKKSLVELTNYKTREIIDSAEKIDDISIVKEIYDNEDMKYINKLVSRITENPKTIALIAVKSSDKANLIFSKSKDIKNFNMNTLLKDVITLIDGRGGGSEFLAQGGGKDNGNIDSALNTAFIKIKNS
ncbi:alanyl-tRNA editing protein [Clostridium hydrogeniformans]|uniref:alanyl-tRNA editing protein n=1 Tax=Clostridium hydrogeniformans TaxID=349933 RepID=UPI000488CFF8|nr:DHHA1 domain-containing protein [Clostridium hydrogeniformans]